MKYLIQLTRIVLGCFLMLFTLSCTVAKEPPKKALSLDKSIRIGHLPNGFTYYLRPTSDAAKISLRFYVKVGNFNERLSENQFAHLVEHIAGNIAYKNAYYANNMNFMNLETYTNAGTDRVHTVYYYSISSRDFKALKGYLQDFINLSNLEMKDDLVKHEARCIRQEFFYRAKGLALNKVINKSKYKTSILFNKDGENPYSSWLASYDMGGISVPSVRDFYQRWYQPDNMGLIITGNIHDMDSLEQQLTELYGKVPTRTGEKDEFDAREFYLSAPPQFKTVEREEVNRFTSWNKEHSEASLIFKVKKFHKNIDTKEKWLNKQFYNAMYLMIDNRLRAYANTIKPIHSEIEKFQFSLANYQIEIKNKVTAERKNIQRVASILQELLRSGFEQEEWNQQKQVMLNQIVAKDTSSRKYWEKQLENHFVYGEILPAHKKSITLQWIDALSLDDINAYLRDNFSVMPDDIYITASAGHPALSYTEKQVRGWIKDAIKAPVDLKEIAHISSLTPLGGKSFALMSKKEVERLKNVDYRKTGIDSDTGLETLQLNNGVKLLLDIKESSETKTQMVSISGTSPKGASCFPKADYYAAISAPEIVMLSGAGGFGRETIRSSFGKEFSLNAEPVHLRVQQNKSMVSTRGSLEDLEKYLQLVYLYFTAPGKDSLAFQKWKNNITESYFSNSIKGVSPKTDMTNAIAMYLNFEAYMASYNPISTQQFYQAQHVDCKQAMACYQAIFGNASQFTFTVKGSYKKEQVLPLLQKYLGNLPSNSNIGCSTKKNGDTLPQGPIYHTFYADKMKTAYKLYTAPYMLTYIFRISEDNWKDRVILGIINTYMRYEVGRKLRFIKGGSVYNESVEGRYSKTNSLYSFTVYVDAIGDELEWIRSECKAIINEIKNNAVSSDIKDLILEDPLFYGKYASSPRLKEKVMQYGHSLTPEDIKKVATKYFKESSQYEFVFMDSKGNVVFP